jgi:hypothetical protein
MSHLCSKSPQLSPAGFAIDPLGLGGEVSGSALKDAPASGAAHVNCLREYGAFLNKRLASVARDPVIVPESGCKDKSPYIHSSVLCSAGSSSCEEAVLGVANLTGVLLNQGTACRRIPSVDASRADMWQLDLTPGAPPQTANPTASYSK